MYHIEILQGASLNGKQWRYYVYNENHQIMMQSLDYATITECAHALSINKLILDSVQVNNTISLNYPL